jgi:hypothetical protein
MWRDTLTFYIITKRFKRYNVFPASPTIIPTASSRGDQVLDRCIQSVPSQYIFVNFNIIFSSTLRFCCHRRWHESEGKKLRIPSACSAKSGRWESRRVSEISISYEYGRSCSSSQVGRMLFHGPAAALYESLTVEAAAFKLSRWKKFYLKWRRCGTAFLDATSFVQPEWSPLSV